MSKFTHDAADDDAADDARAMTIPRRFLRKQLKKSTADLTHTHKYNSVEICMSKDFRSFMFLRFTTSDLSV